MRRRLIATVRWLARAGVAAGVAVVALLIWGVAVEPRFILDLRQVRLPFTPRWTWMSLAADDVVRADGWIEGFGQPENRLYVNRGIGFSMLPIRINCAPELTMFTLRRGPLP